MRNVSSPRPCCSFLQKEIAEAYDLPECEARAWARKAHVALSHCRLKRRQSVNGKKLSPEVQADG